MATHDWAVVEEKRLTIQAELDALKSSAERNKLGQFATPTSLARDIVKYAGGLIPEKEPIAFLDPAVGTGSFYSALRNVYPNGRVDSALGHEVDPHYGHPSIDLWKAKGLSLKLSDFTLEEPKPDYNLIICNPPYVRHHHLSASDKARLLDLSFRSGGVKLSGLAGLYCHFLAISHAWMKEGGIAAWLIPSEFMDVNYGRAIKEYLLTRVTLLSIHRFDPQDVQFADALVSSAVVVFKNSPPPVKHKVAFTFGGKLSAPHIKKSYSVSDLRDEQKWTRFPNQAVRKKSTSLVFSDLFKVKRGLATGNNDFFIHTKEDIKANGWPMELFRPILPSPRYLTEDIVLADAKGRPVLKSTLYLLDTKLPEEEIATRYPLLSAYLEEGKKALVDKQYLCSRRVPWYSQENRPAAPMYCTYLGRSDKKSGRPFRFIRNLSSATVTNVYLALYPTEMLATLGGDPEEMLTRIWKYLNTIPAEDLLGEGRVYGGGLHKLEPRELGNVKIDLSSLK